MEQTSFPQKTLWRYEDNPEVEEILLKHTETRFAHDPLPELTCSFQLGSKASAAGYPDPDSCQLQK